MSNLINMNHFANKTRVSSVGLAEHLHEYNVSWRALDASASPHPQQTLQMCCSHQGDGYWIVAGTARFTRKHLSQTESC